MQANEFVKKFGWVRVKDILKNAPSNAKYWNEGFEFQCGQTASTIPEEAMEKHFVPMADLKRLFISRHLVQEHGSIERVKEYANSPYTAPEIKERLQQAISDVESCQPDLPETVVQSLGEIS
jgi:hypothetical protein